MYDWNTYFNQIFAINHLIFESEPNQISQDVNCTPLFPLLNHGKLYLSNFWKQWSIRSQFYTGNNKPGKNLTSLYKFIFFFHLLINDLSFYPVQNLITFPLRKCTDDVDCDLCCEKMNITHACTPLGKIVDICMFCKTTTLFGTCPNGGICACGLSMFDSEDCKSSADCSTVYNFTPEPEDC